MQISGQYANKLGKVFPDTILFCKSVIVGYDKEEHERIFEELVEGLMSRGIDVYSIGIVSYSQFNFACSFYKNSGAIYISENYTLVDKKGLMSSKKIKKIENKIIRYKWKEKNPGEFIPVPIKEDYELEMDKEIHFSNRTIQINSTKNLDFLLPYTKLIKKNKMEIKKSTKLSVLIENDKIQFFKSGEIPPESILPNFFDKFQKSFNISPLIKGKFSEKIKIGGNSGGQYFFKQLKLPSPTLALIYFLNKEIKRTEEVFTLKIKFKNSLKQLKKELKKEKISCKSKKSVLFNKNWFTATVSDNLLLVRGTREEIKRIIKVANKIK